MYITTETLVFIRLHRKADFMMLKISCTKGRKVCVDENKLGPAKEWHHRPSGLGSRLVVVVRQ